MKVDAAIANTFARGTANILTATEPKGRRQVSDYSEHASCTTTKAPRS